MIADKTLEDPFDYAVSDCPTGIAHIGKRQRREIAKRAAILQTATGCFLEQGYGGVTMSDIAERLGGSKGTLWKYFRSKDMLFEAVIVHACGHIHASIPLEMERSKSPKTVLTDFADGYIRRSVSADHIALYRTVIGVLDRFPKLGRTYFDHRCTAVRDPLADYIAYLMEAGQLACEDAQLAAGTFLALCDVGHSARVLLAAERPDGSAATAKAALAVDLFLKIFRAET